MQKKKRGIKLPFVVQSFSLPQCYYHFNNKGQKEQSQQPVVWMFFDPYHPPDGDQWKQDEQSSGDDGTQKAEQTHGAVTAPGKYKSQPAAGSCAHTERSKKRRAGLFKQRPQTCSSACLLPLTPSYCSLPGPSPCSGKRSAQIGGE